MAKFAWDPKSQRYRFISGPKSGQYVSYRRVSQLMEENISQISGDLETISNLLLEGKISLATWERQLAEAIKLGHTLGYTVGRGGRLRLNATDRGLVSARLRQEFAYLRRFSTAIQAGKLTPDQILDRTRKYASSFYTTYEVGRLSAARGAGMRWERRKTTPGEICSDCVGYASQGWVPIGMLPVPGIASKCGSRCRCQKIYSGNFVRPRNSITKVSA